MTRRGFTLLETMLAIAVGSLVVAAALGVLSTIRQSDRELALQSHDMNQLARTQLAVREAMMLLLAAESGVVRATLTDLPSESVDAVLTTANPAPIPGLAARIEMTTSTNPRLEIVLSEPLLDAPRRSGATNTPPALGEMGMLATVTAEQLPGHRGAFELRRETDARWPSLWWVPLSPRDVPVGVVFDESTLPPPRRLCRDVTSLTWTAFIDSQRVPQVRAIESAQFPAFIELEIATAGGAYGNWTFELGWTVGPELEAPPEIAEALGDDQEGSDATDPALVDPTELDPDAIVPGDLVRESDE